ncbi:hypothetical protein B0A48_16600 [Cryoendolithus antarcticus]|uniref:Uncharacterized protein n=1 Tax=Cryoendolithus antarcticus TaxID=1507870 RepID=A0A1V8SF31_9PEZI|nr:hypothetical protein B0A48_16600 [Cryoendolithus antarcticus]
MARKSSTPTTTTTSTPDTRTKAAYSASQPLFDAVRLAVTALDEQKAHLITARVVVQQVHVKLPNGDAENNGLVHETYIDRLVKAWTSTTSSYLGVFEELLKLQAPDEVHGKVAGPLFEEFETLKGSVEKAKEAAMSFNPAANPPRAPLATKRSAQAMDDSDNSDTSQTSSKRAKLETPQRIKQTQVPKLSKRQRKIQAAQDRPTGVRPWEKPNKRQGPRQQRLALRKAKEAAALIGQTGANSTPLGARQAEPQVQYEDVTAEASARLQAKDEAKKAKKRKRDSVGSGFLTAEVGGEERAVQIRDEGLKEKPARKKVRDAEGEGVRVDPVEGEKKSKGKRAKAEDGAAEEGSEVRKKRKKVE